MKKNLKKTKKEIIQIIEEYQKLHNNLYIMPSVVYMSSKLGVSRQWTNTVLNRLIEDGVLEVQKDAFWGKIIKKA